MVHGSVIHADYDYGALCGETEPDSSGVVATSLRRDEVTCERCLAVAQPAWRD